VKQSINSEIFKIAIIAFGLTFFYLLLYKIYIPHTNSFGCFDDCMNISAGYFLQYGRTLYSEIFFNHQPNLAYLSFADSQFMDAMKELQEISWNFNFVN